MKIAPSELGYMLARQVGYLHLVAQYEALVLAAQLEDRPTSARISRKASWPPQEKRRGL